MNGPGAITCTVRKPVTAMAFDGGFLLALGFTSAVALQDAGHGPCGIDSCNAWMVRGDILLVARLGPGYAF